MLGTVRYKCVTNEIAGGLPLTVANFPFYPDGEDRQIKVVRRVLVAADIGANPGQVSHQLGAIIDAVSPSFNVLWVLGFIYRPLASVDGMTPYNDVNNDIAPDKTVPLQFEVGLYKDNTIRVMDKGDGGAGGSPILAGDVITIVIFIGERENPLDFMNLSLMPEPVSINNIVTENVLTENLLTEDISSNESMLAEDLLVEDTSTKDIFIEDKLSNKDTLINKGENKTLGLNKKLSRYFYRIFGK